MKKLILILGIGLLVLTSCSKDEIIVLPPEPEPADYTTLYMATNGFYDYPELVVSQQLDHDGEIVYQCEDAQSSILSLAAVGNDWYAVILRGDGAYNVVKNGESIQVTGEVIHCFAVEDGSIYTVQENKLYNTVWVYKDFQRLYEVVGDVLYNTFSVDQGNVTMAVYGEPDYWYNGEFLPIEGLEEGGVKWVYGIDKKGDDMLITYQDINSGKNMYWWNGTAHELSSQFIPHSSCIVNGHSFINGRKIVSQGVGSQHGLPTVLMDGYENVLSTYAIDCSVVQTVAANYTTYFLVKSVRNASSYIFAGFRLLDLPTIDIPDEYKQYYPYYSEGKMNLSNLGIKCFAVSASQEQQ